MLFSESDLVFVAHINHEWHHVVLIFSQWLASISTALSGLLNLGDISVSKPVVPNP